MSTEISWIVIPEGDFDKGCSPNDDACYDYEKPVHTVSISTFEMSETEITQAQYEKVMENNPSIFPCRSCPVENVKWYNAKAFCEAVGGRLLTESEWEYAARAGTTTKYYCGDDESCLDSIAWYSENSEGTTHPSGKKLANDFGLYDTLGNVWEWVEDSWSDDYSSNPTGELFVDENNSYKIVRGGTWGLDAVGLRVSNRDADYPDVYFLPPLGVRCAKDIE